MIIQKLEGAPAFLALDLGDEVFAAGPVRNAKKILQDGAKTIARSITYGYAALHQQRGGVSGGISAIGDERGPAISAFVGELTPSVSQGKLSLDAAKGLGPDELGELAAADTRSPLHRQDLDGIRIDDRATARSVATIAELASGGLDGRTVAIEVFDQTSLASVSEFTDRGAKVISLSSEAGTVAIADGVDPGALAEAWAAEGPASLGTFGDLEARNKVMGAPADVLVVGSKVGALTHQGAAYVKAGVVVPNGAVPVTTKAFVTLRDAGCTVVPDFISTAGRQLSWHTDAQDYDSLAAANDTALTSLWQEINSTEDGPLMAACLHSEAYLKTWQESLPFGRPLA